MLVHQNGNVSAIGTLSSRAVGDAAPSFQHPSGSNRALQLCSARMFCQNSHGMTVPSTYTPLVAIAAPNSHQGKRAPLHHALLFQKFWPLLCVHALINSTTPQVRA